MERTSRSDRWLLLVGLWCLVCATTALGQQRTTVSGFIFGVNNERIEKVQVELLNDADSVLARTKSDGGGRYVFPAIQTLGRLSVRVLPLGTNYDEQTQMIEQSDIGTRGRLTESVQLDFRLRLRRSAAAGSMAVVYFQEVPKPAQKVFDQAVEELNRKNTDKGIDLLMDAVDLFPTYFVALERLGQEFIKRREYEKARLTFEQASLVNSRSFSTMFGLAVSSFTTGKFEAARDAAEKAAMIDKTSVGAHYILGRAQRKLKMYDAAEKSLLEARKYDNGATPDILWELALLSAHNLKKYDLAANYLEEYLKLNPKKAPADKIKQLIADFRAKS